MLNRMVSLIAIGIWTIAAGPIWAQSDSLPSEEELLSRAMQHNPEIRRARAELEVAIAQLSATEMEVKHELLPLRARLDRLQRNRTQLMIAADEGLESAAEGEQVKVEIAEKRAEIEVLKSRLFRLTGGNPARYGHAPSNEELVHYTMEHNLEIRGARALLEMARAELSYAEMEVAEQLIRFRTEYEILASDNTLQMRAAENGLNSASEGEEYQVERARQQAELATLHYRLIRLTGDNQIFDGQKTIYVKTHVTPSGTTPQRTGSPQPRPQLDETTPEAIREALSKSTTIVFEEIQLRDLLEFVQVEYGINFVIDVQYAPPPITINVGAGTDLHGALLALTDLLGDAVFILRDYGFFVTIRDHASSIAGFAIPDSVPYFNPHPAPSEMKILGDIPNLKKVVQ